MVTVVAVTGRPNRVVDEEAVDGVPTAVTQIPATNADAVVEIVLVKTVDALKVTVVCPLVGFWTSRVVPLTAAMVPVAAGKAALAPAAGVDVAVEFVEEATTEVLGAEIAVAVLPHAASRKLVLDITKMDLR